MATVSSSKYGRGARKNVSPNWLRHGSPYAVSQARFDTLTELEEYWFDAVDFETRVDQPW